MRSDGNAAILTCVTLLVTLSCSNPTVPATSTQPAELTNKPRVVFPDGFVVRVELATDNESRAQGLMFRDKLRDGTGMLFLFPTTGEYPFWMKNTLIPLDMVWIDEQRRIVHVKTDVPPCEADPCPSYAPGVPARYILEVAAGVARQHQLRAGNVLRFENVEGVVVQ